jgi:hypothetical protein
MISSIDFSSVFSFVIFLFCLFEYLVIIDYANILFVLFYMIFIFLHIVKIFLFIQYNVFYVFFIKNITQYTKKILIFK